MLLLLVKYSCPRDLDLSRFFISGDFRFWLGILLDLFSASCSEARSRSLPAPRVRVPKKLLSLVCAPASVAAWTAPRIFLFTCACPLARFPCTSWPLLVSIPCSCLRYFPRLIFGAQDSFWLSGFPSSYRFGWHRSRSSRLGFPVLDFSACASGFIDSRSRVATQSAVWFLLPPGIRSRIQALNHFSLASIWVHGHNLSSSRE
jgi:hypothetical protein